MTAPMTPSTFWTTKVRKTESCWFWTGFVRPDGYGRIGVKGKQELAHRYAYEITNGSIPEDFKLDHICHNEDLNCPGGSSCQHRKCVRPSHLIPKTDMENVRSSRVSTASKNAAKTHCPQGHEYSDSNTYVQFLRNGTEG